MRSSTGGKDERSGVRRDKEVEKKPQQKRLENITLKSYIHLKVQSSMSKHSFHIKAVSMCLLQTALMYGLFQSMVQNPFLGRSRISCSASPPLFCPQEPWLINLYALT